MKGQDIVNKFTSDMQVLVAKYSVSANYSDPNFLANNQAEIDALNAKFHDDLKTADWGWK